MPTTPSGTSNTADDMWEKSPAELQSQIDNETKVRKVKGEYGSTLSWKGGVTTEGGKGNGKGGRSVVGVVTEQAKGVFESPGGSARGTLERGKGIVEGVLGNVGGGASGGGPVKKG